MAQKQRQAAKTSHKKTQATGRARKKPGSSGEGNYYHIDVRPADEFTTFRTQDVGDAGHLQRVAGKRSSGSWSTAAWLISKEDAHVEDGKLVGDTREAKDLLKKLGSSPAHLSGDRFEAKDRRNVPERSKPTAAQTRARRQNIKKAQATRHDRS
jgi:hypothetical protein